MIQFHTVPTANGHKVRIVLEETGLAYALAPVDLYAGEHKKPGYKAALSPFGKAPAIVDPDGPGGVSITLSETLAIAWYLAEKAASDMLPRGPGERAEFLMWASAVSSQLAGAFTNQFVATVMAPEKTPWAIERSLADCHEQLAAFEARLASRVYMLGERFTILDALFFPMVASSAKRLEGGLERYPNLARYEAFIAQRPGVQRGMANG
ncbi:glutathione S-transferase family protein [Caulobacter endophyticus]|uniref:glutathione S-transferase family protein n=1 Tax=Caulobacter endophyticus TaxID=2172652 RepID=UPI00240F357E|nr:glutathione S-transferase family protein [Caulobacter endophyticus]MDG2527489.1 glutathione S-transferase family protein [Caulobacter endophyticus]